MKSFYLFIVVVIINIALGISYTNYDPSSEVNDWTNRKTEERGRINWLERNEQFREITPEELNMWNNIDGLFSVAAVRDVIFVLYVFSFIGIFIVGFTDVKKLLSTDFNEQEGEVWNAFTSGILGIFAFVSCHYASRGGWEAFSFSMVMVVFMAAMLVVMRRK